MSPNLTKSINTISWVIIATLHICFIVAIARDYAYSLTSVVLCLIVSGLLIWAYRSSFLAYANFKWEDVYTFGWLTLGGASTFLISTETIAGPVIAAGLVGLIGSFIPKGNNEKSILHKGDIAVYCGTFLGMSSSFVMEHVYQVIVACIISSGLYILTKNILPGYGGKLGTLAFGGVVIFKVIADGI